MADSKPQNEPTAGVDLRLPKPLHDEFVKFCDWTRRDQAETAGEILKLFFADGFRTAFERLRAENPWTGKRAVTYSDKRLMEIYRAIDDDEKKNADSE